MNSILFLAALAAQQNANGAIGAPLEIPPIIARAVVPYLMCTTEQTNVALGRHGSGLENLDAVRGDVRRDCAEARQTAFASSESILRPLAEYRNGAVRRAFIETVLGNIDSNHDRLFEAVRATLSGQTSGPPANAKN